jgi:hypothetical protein
MPIPAFTIEVSDDAVIAPEAVPGGIVRVTIKNSSSSPLDISLARVLAGSTPKEVITLAQGGEEVVGLDHGASSTSLTGLGGVKNLWEKIPFRLDHGASSTSLTGAWRSA